MSSEVSKTIEDNAIEIIRKAPFFMLRYETQYTPCTGITAVNKQERAHFGDAVTIAPWCYDDKKEKIEITNITPGNISKVGTLDDISGIPCSIWMTHDDKSPIIYIKLDGRFQGKENPYDTPFLKEDTLLLGLAVEKLLLAAGATSKQFVWGADWETAPALLRVRNRHHVSLTLHNSYDEEISHVVNAMELGKEYPEFSNATVLKAALTHVDVVTGVNRGFVHGIRTGGICHINTHHWGKLRDRIVPINNASFSTLTEEQKKLRDALIAPCGIKELLKTKEEAQKALREKTGIDCSDKVVIMTMGRRSSQKLHDVLVKSVWELLAQDKTLPLFVFFATTGGDPLSGIIQERIKALRNEFSDNVFFTVCHLPYYKTLATAAHYNCMPSLYEPHGGAFEGIVVPIARAVDGLAEQIHAYEPEPSVKSFDERWHYPGEPPTGFLFREDLDEIPDDLSELERDPSTSNDTSTSMVKALSATLMRAIHVWQNDKETYAKLVLNCLEKQGKQSWFTNMGGMLSLIEEARIKRPL